MKSWVIAALVVTVAMLLMMSTTAVEANKPHQVFNFGDGEGEDGSSSGLFTIMRRMLSRRLGGGGGNGDGDSERGGFFNGILQLLNNLFTDGDDGDVETTTGGTSERLRMMVQGRKRIRGFIHTFIGTLANYGFECEITMTQAT
ncbi:hypothetical protein Pmani_003269 [Petrolisthes manimaculis]|uniref:Uncharacterized protein n=1 Tax=Petrolisthes manimaculis TaxID=1843537 RepID=A0AAE1QGY0_9EUCA|nr:hypothetical protein Pmani_003269 [Petrolisthes manimaculis]